MAILHTVNKSPHEKNSLESCLRYAKEGSAVLLIEDGVYAALKDSAFADDLTDVVGKIALFCLGPDLKARGFSSAKVIEGVALVDYEGFVDLTVEYDKVQAWL